jgi:hypothetical protein
MQDVLSSKTIFVNFEKEYFELGNSVDVGIETIFKKVRNNYYLIAVNSDKNMVKVKIGGLSKFMHATVLKEDRSLALVAGNLTDTFKPFDVHIYKLKK